MSKLVHNNNTVGNLKPKGLKQLNALCLKLDEFEVLWKKGLIKKKYSSAALAAKLVNQTVTETSDSSPSKFFEYWAAEVGITMKHIKPRYIVNAPIIEFFERLPKSIGIPLEYLGHNVKAMDEVSNFIRGKAVCN